MIGTRKPIKEIAEALGCNTRSIETLVDYYKVPYIRVLRQKYVEPGDIQQAALRAQNAPPRGPGRRLAVPPRREVVEIVAP